MDAGGWKMEDGSGRMENGGRIPEYGRRKTVDEKWKMKKMKGVKVEILIKELRLRSFGFCFLSSDLWLNDSLAYRFRDSFRHGSYMKLSVNIINVRAHSFKSNTAAIGDHFIAHPIHHMR